MSAPVPDEHTNAVARARVGLTVKHARTGEPLDVDADITRASIVLRIGDTITAVSQRNLEPGEALVFADQLARAAGATG